ncbi:flippase-like domain-containing protein [Streptomyces thermocarboxydus]|nr:flippase-like domain-containing protein [Streptomyces thermocarboxydus]
MCWRRASDGWGCWPLCWWRSPTRCRSGRCCRTRRPSGRSSRRARCSSSPSARSPPCGGCGRWWPGSCGRRWARRGRCTPGPRGALWGGALAFPALQAGVLVLVARAFGLAVPSAHLAVAYLAATVAVALVPTPGGIGSVEAALVVALVAAGGTAAVATAVVVVFRLLTVWLPLLPGALTLAALLRMRVI